MSTRRHLAFARGLVLTWILAALAPATAQAMGGSVGSTTSRTGSTTSRTGSTTSRTSSTPHTSIPTFPVPASARVHGAGTGTPTTTYAPPASTTTTPLPGTAIPPAATTTPGATPTSPSGTPSLTPLNRSGTARASAHPRSKRKLSAAAIAIAAAAALLVLGCCAWAIARRRAFEPHWLLSLRHASAEAGFRVSATWSEFTDWARLGH
jgi:hypothetical protein